MKLYVSKENLQRMERAQGYFSKEKTSHFSEAITIINGHHEVNPTEKGKVELVDTKQFFWIRHKTNGHCLVTNQAYTKFEPYRLEHWPNGYSSNYVNYEVVRPATPEEVSSNHPFTGYKNIASLDNVQAGQRG